jgi:endo-1,4-beta-xylanase
MVFGGGLDAAPAGARPAAASRPVAPQPEAKMTGLKDLAEKRGILFGVAAVGKLLADADSAYARTIARECNVITPENDMKFEPLRPGPDTWNWERADALVDFAARHGLKVHGHTLIWHMQLPDWLKDRNAAPEQCRDLLVEHIEAVAGRYRGKIYAWDVVNEAIADDAGWRSSFWYDALGEPYIDLAFRTAHKVDPHAKLIYNDYGIETVNKKSNAVYELVKGMKQRGVPIHGVGMQAHLRLDRCPEPDAVRANVERFRDLGLEVWITELDVRIKTPVTDHDLARQAECYGDLVRAWLDGGVRAIQTWGLDDGHSWIPSWFDGSDQALLFDRHMQPKPAYFAVADALKAGGNGKD